MKGENEVENTNIDSRDILISFENNFSIILSTDFFFGKGQKFNSAIIKVVFKTLYFRINLILFKRDRNLIQSS